MSRAGIWLTTEISTRCRADIDAIDRDIQRLIRPPCPSAPSGLPISRLADVLAAQERGEAEAEVVYYRPEREAQVLQPHHRAQRAGRCQGENVAHIFREIMSACLALERAAAGGLPGSRGYLHPGRRHQAFWSRRCLPCRRATIDDRVRPGRIRRMQLRRGAGGELHRGHGQPHPGQLHGLAAEDLRRGGDAYRPSPAGGGEHTDSDSDRPASALTSRRWHSVATGSTDTGPRSSAQAVSSNGEAARIAAAEPRASPPSPVIWRRTMYQPAETGGARRGLRRQYHAFPGDRSRGSSRPPAEDKTSIIVSSRNQTRRPVPACWNRFAAVG